MRSPIVLAIVLGVGLIGVFLLKRASIEGKLILGAAVVSLIAFFRYPHYLLLLISMTFFTFVGVALLWAWIASMKVRIVRDLKEEAMAGENVPVKYNLWSQSPLPLYHARVWDKAFRQRSDESHEETPFEDPGYLGLLSVKKGEKSDGTLHFVPPVRGLVSLGPIAVEGGDPFGIFTLINWIPASDECLVLPAWEILSTLPSIHARLGAREHEHLVSKEGHSHEFLGTRPYSEGDSLRGVHWPLTAKHNELIVRQYQKEVEEEILIILDADREADVGDGSENALEYLITLGLSLANAASEMGRPWTLVIADKETITINHRSKEAMLQAQHALARLNATRENPIENILGDIRREYRGAACMLLTARTDEGVSEAVSQTDRTIGGGPGSMVIRVDSSTFAGLGEDSISALKKKRSGHDPRPVEMTSGSTQVTELTISRGDNIGEIFLGQGFA